MIVTLRREAKLAEVTLGFIEVSGRKFPTIENPSAAADRHDACIPPGAYRLLPRQRASGEKAYAVVNAALGVWERPTDVPRAVTDARSAVYLAAGHVIDDLIGCHIAPGKQRAKRNGAWELEGSRDAMNEIRTLIANKLDITLVVEEGV